MAKNTVDLSQEERDKVARFSLKWKINFNETIKRMVKEFPEQQDLFNTDLDLGETRLW